jgi:ethanolamine utilization microcompartment shell protein EutS
MNSACFLIPNTTIAPHFPHNFSLILTFSPGTAAMLAHMIHNDEAAKKAAAGIKASAVGVATPAVLTEQLADQCSDYITSVVLMVSGKCNIGLLLQSAWHADMDCMVYFSASAR